MDDEKIKTLEERIAWLQRHVLEQDKAMFQMSDTLRRLETQLAALQERTRDASSGGPEAGSPANERPPHY